MSALKPFEAVFYNKEKFENLVPVFCPPYDIISQEQQDAYYKQDPYNFIRLELAKETPKDDEKDNKYTRARKTYEEWFKKGILKQDETACIYFYKQDYKYQGQKYTRMGFLGLLKINEDNGVRILPHEHTHAAAKTDRFTLWSALKSDLSPIFIGYADKAGKIDRIFLKELANQKPFLETVDHDKVKHTIWRLENTEKIQEIVNVIEGQNLFICDGHHRFEVANQIRREALKKGKKITGEEPYNYVMTYFTNMDSKDLQIFPIHRIVKKFPISVNLLEQYFRIDKVKTKVDWLVLLARAGQNEHAFGLYNKQGMFLLRLKNKTLIDKMVKEGSKDYRSLDAAILKAFILDQVGVADEDIVYSKDPDEVLQAVNEGNAEAGFILNPVLVTQLRSIALNDERMPPKTTYFYPKVLSGLTIYKMDYFPHMSLFGKSNYTFIKVKRKEIPAGVWTKCPGCESPAYSKELKNNLNVCPKCGFHLSLNAHERIEHLIDEGTFVETDGGMVSADPLKFQGPKSYKEKLKADQDATELKDAVITGHGQIEGKKAVIAVTDSRFIMGSMGSVVGEKITRLVEYATEEKLPVIIISGSGGGARMYEGAISLMQMAKTCAALQRHAEAGLLYVSVLTNPTMGGIMASFAGVGDVIIAEPKALIGFAGPRVVEQTIRQKLPSGFQRSEFLLAHGMIDMIVERQDLKGVLAHTINYCQD